MSVVLPAAPLPAEPAPESGAGNGPATAVPEQLRLCIHVANYFVDTSVSAHAPLSVVMEGLVPFLVDTLRNEGLAIEFDRAAVYSLAVEGGMAFPRTTTLADAGVLDGARLILREVHSNEVFRPIIEDSADAMAEFNAAKFASFSPGTARVLGLAALIAGSMLLAVLSIAAWWATSSIAWWLPPTAALALIAVSGAVIAGRRGATQISYTLGLAALPLALAAGWVAVPAYDGIDGHWTAANICAGIFTAGGVSLIVLWLTGIGNAAHTAVVTLSVAGAAAAAVRVYTGFDGRQIAAVAVLVGAILIASAQAMALGLARVRPPSLPPPGEDIDRSELEEAALVVEVFDDPSGVRSVALAESEDAQLERRSRASNKYLTGLFIAAVIITAVGAVAAVYPQTHYFYGEVALAISTTLVLALRGRSLTDRVQAVTFFLGAFAVAVGLAITVVLGTHSPVAQLSVLGGTALAVVLAALAALRIPGAKISELTARRTENLEFLLILAGPPLVVWITGTFAALRNLF
ncbi:type VII secretion integral membrane protein EccD [Mycobacterium riyadhense]|uniref:ESX-1 secretion system protein eccD1 n=1 Tax=Mycobacterium riyadhense TaxID=486698 RepID=A0A653EPY9_9MYCO|nr:type VII secretion integral membrane protein EccD [Mycobacterium riyadhense]VTO99594.1 ESX-1 secretion system protein eccD1 [Mycobacterium riyadhense]